MIRLPDIITDFIFNHYELISRFLFCFGIKLQLIETEIEDEDKNDYGYKMNIPLDNIRSNHEMDYQYEMEVVQESFREEGFAEGRYYTFGAEDIGDMYKKYREEEE